MASTNRSVWNGNLAFGLVVMPVSLHTATEDHDVKFHQLHRADGGRIGYQKVCKDCGEEVPFGDIAKGYDTGEESIMLGERDLDDMPLATRKTLEVLTFVDPLEVNPLMFSKSYYIKPGKDGGAGPYALLAETLRITGKAGIVKVALRQREALGMLTVDENGGLVLITLLWPDEVRDAPKPDALNLDPIVLAQAQALVTAMSGPFNPGEYSDDYTEAVSNMIQAKRNGTEQPPVAQPSAAVPMDLSAVLTASLKAKKAKKSKK